MVAAPARLDVARLYQEYGSLVLRRIRRFYPQQVAVDVLQEVFARVVEKAHTFRGEGTERAWLFGLTTRHCLARLRDERRRRQLLDEVGEVPWSCPVTPPSAEAAVFLGELWRDLDPELLQIGVHYYVDGMSQEAIGALLGVTGRTISTRLTTLRDLARARGGDA
ncbi:MAG: sigma-70 family RNA polymerase sigma factor [Myxococcota bacterium]